MLLVPLLCVLPAAEILTVTVNCLIFRHEYPALPTADGVHRRALLALLSFPFARIHVAPSHLQQEQQPCHEQHDQPEKQFSHDSNHHVGLMGADTIQPRSDSVNMTGIVLP